MSGTIVERDRKEELCQLNKSPELKHTCGLKISIC